MKLVRFTLALVALAAAGSCGRSGPSAENGSSSQGGPREVVVYSSISIDDSPPRPKQASYPISKIALERLIEAWQGEHRQVGFTSIANGDTLTEFGFGESMEKLIPIVQRWSELDYMYGRMMDAESVAEQVVNAIASRETIRRIAITPHYPDVVETVDEMGLKAVETVRGGKS